MQSLEEQVTELRAAVGRTERRIRVQNILLGLVTVVSLGLAAATPAGAQVGDTVASLASRLAFVENKTADMSIVQMPMTDDANPLNVRTVRFTNVNVQLVNGTGATQTVNARGNLIIGYNEFRGGPNDDDRRGSHNLVIGNENNYTPKTWGGQVVGSHNTIDGSHACVSGGVQNTASGDGSSVSGGSANTAVGGASSVSGGSANTAVGGASSVSGGFGNKANGYRSSISGGAVVVLEGTPCYWAAGGPGNVPSGQFHSP
jgi:hypothetical protein